MPIFLNYNFLLFSSNKVKVIIKHEKYGLSFLSRKALEVKLCNWDILFLNKQTN